MDADVQYYLPTLGAICTSEGLIDFPPRWLCLLGIRGKFHGGKLSKGVLGSASYCSSIVRMRKGDSMRRNEDSMRRGCRI